MKMHHQGAIDMANKELEKGTNADMRTKAQQIIDKQQTEIETLNGFIQNHTPESSATGQEFDMEMTTSMEKMNKNADLQVLTGNTDNDFVALMIVHHQSATEMAQSLQHHGQDEDLKNMAKMMNEDQNSEIIEMQTWLLNNKKY
jgi:uncharacterized protein (DUF305 family)